MAASHAAAARAMRSRRSRRRRRSANCGIGTCARSHRSCPVRSTADASREIGDLAHRYLDGRSGPAGRADRAGTHRRRPRRPARRRHLLPGRRTPDPRLPRVRRPTAVGRRAVRRRLPRDGPRAAGPRRSGADAFLDWYREFSAETHPLSLEHHYIAYRALVRAKISCLEVAPTTQWRRVTTSLNAGGICSRGGCSSSSSAGCRERASPRSLPPRRRARMVGTALGRDPQGARRSRTTRTCAVAPTVKVCTRPSVTATTYEAMFAQAGDSCSRGRA